MPSLVEILVLGPNLEQRFVAERNGTITVGRSSDCQVVLDESLIGQGRLHLDWACDQELTLGLASGGEDLETRGGVRLEGDPVDLPVILGEGKEISLGGAKLTWRHLPREEWPTLASGDAPSSAAEKLGEELQRERYEFGAEVGRGGMGQVVIATEKPLQRPIALKKLLRPANKEDQERFIREARITGRLQHPSIVPVHELSADENGSPFYTMKLVQGLTLHEILRSLSQGNSEALRRYPLPALLTIIQKVCDAVAFAHAQPEPVIHRDLKPENIMIGDYGEVLVMDWGSAKILWRDELPPPPWTGYAVASPLAHEFPADDQGERESKDELENGFLTLPGSIMGTPGYMAPEQARGQADAADERTDVYALGAILYALLTLEAPVRLTAKEAQSFEERRQTGENLRDLFGNHVAPVVAGKATRAKFLHLPGRKLPDSLVAVVRKAMSLNPENRFASVKAFQADIAAYQAGFATSAEEAGVWTRFHLLLARNKSLFTALATIIVILLTATFASLRERHLALESNRSLEEALHRASFADNETARQRFRSGLWREGVAFIGRSLAYWHENQVAAKYLLGSIVFARGDQDKLPLFGAEHSGTIFEADFSADDRYFVTASYDHTARIWDAATGAPVGKTLAHDSVVSCARFSPDGRKIVTATESGFIRIWNARTGEPLLPPIDHGGKDFKDPASRIVESAIFSSDGRRILTARWDGTARVWDAVTGEEIARLENPNRVASAVFSPDGSRILTSYWQGGAMLWDAATFQPVGVPMVHAKTVRKALFSPDGRRVVTSSLDKTARIWDAQSGLPLSPPLQHADFVWSLAVSPDGRLLATAGHDKMARLWSMADGAPVGQPMEHEAPVNTVTFSPDGSLLVTASRDKKVRLWNTKTCQQVGETMRHDDSVLGAIFNHRGTRILSFGWDGRAYLWEIHPRPSAGEAIPFAGPVRFIDLASDSDHLLAASADGRAGVWSLSKHRYVSPIVKHGVTLTAAALNSSQPLFATTGEDGIVRFWDSHSGTHLGETPPSRVAVSTLLFSKDGRSIFAAYSDGTVRSWKAPEGIALGPPMKQHGKVNALALSPSGRELATSCRDEFIRFWDTTTGHLLDRKLRLEYQAFDLSYSPDGQSLATGSADHSARIWSLETGKQLGRTLLVDGPVNSVCYLEGGRALLIAGSEDPAVNCYDPHTGSTLIPALIHSRGVLQVEAGPDGDRIATVTNDGVARLWRIPHTTQPPPAWLPDYLRAIGGLAFSSEQHLVEVPMRERVALRQKLLAMPSDSSVWETVMRSSFQR